MPGSRSLHPIPPQLLANLVEQTPALVLLTDRDGRLVYVNEGFTEMTGYTPAEALGQSPRLLKSGLRDQTFYAHLWETVLSGRSWNMLVPNRRKDGSTYWQQTNIFPLTDDEGRIVYFAGVGRDVTDRVKMTEELATARDAAEAAARVKSEFLVNMSHEIRTPLNAVLGMADLLADTDLDVRQKGQLEVLRTAGESLLGLVNEIMDLSKLEAGGMRLEEETFDLRALLEGAASVVAPMAHARELELLVRIEPDADRPWRGDPVRVRQVVMNLLSNAVKFTEEGEVELRAEPGGEGRSEGLRISIRDTGVGIPAERLESVFERFSQIDGSMTRRHGGSGLGLALCRELTTLMGGTLRAESEPGVGSTFTVEVPLRPAEDTPPASTRALAGGRVVLADDHAGHRAVLRDLLERSGAAVTEVDALEHLGRVIDQGAEDGRPFGVAVVDDTWARGDLEATVDRVSRKAGAPGIVLVTRVQDAHDPGAAVHERVVQPVPWSRLEEAVCRARRHGASPSHEPSASGHATRSPDADWPRRVLVVDDNAVNRLLVRALLTKQGCEVEEAENGREALARLDRSPAVGAVLMDLVMPEMDGYAAVRTIRAREAEAGDLGVPIIAFSASTAPREIEAALEAGCDGHVGKPVRKEELLDGIRAAVGRRRALTTT